MSSSDKQTPGLTDTAAVGAHDIIHNAELEEQKVQGSHSMTGPDDEYQPNTSQGGTQEGKTITDKVKGALNMK